MPYKKKTEKADDGDLGGTEGADLTASSSASGWELFKESIPKKISTADVFMNKNRLPSKSSRQLEGPGTNPPDFGGIEVKKAEIAAEEDTLMGRLAKRMASRDYIDKQNLGMGTKAQKATVADCGKEYAKYKSNIKEIADDSEYMKEYNVGKKIEEEHKDTVDKIKAGKIKSNEDAYGAITTDHMKEFPDYYDDKKGLPEMEKALKKETASMADNLLIEGLHNEMQKESITPYWEKMQRIRGKELDVSGEKARLDKIEEAWPSVPSTDDFADPAKTELIMPGATMVDQAKNTGRVIGRKFI